ncbi:MAG: tRNA (adenosine(37)-N6)-dimethylallyltransferase MiaA [Chthoniobacterales bacterium]
MANAAGLPVSFSPNVKGVFFLVGPTGTGKSELAAAVAEQINAEVVSADAYQLYRGLGLLTAQPDAATLEKVRHHLIDLVDPTESMNAERFRRLATAAIAEIHGRGRAAIVVGGSGLYIRALVEGLSPLPSADAVLRDELEASTTQQLHERLRNLDPALAQTIDARNRRRLVRALEVCILTGTPFSRQRDRPNPPAGENGVLLLRERAELSERLDRRVATMFAQGVVHEVIEAGAVGATAARTLGYAAIQELIAGRITEAECIAAMQQATRRYAKRQLTWFRHQTSFPVLNLSVHGFSEAIEWIKREACRSFALRDVRN